MRYRLKEVFKNISIVSWLGLILSLVCYLMFVVWLSHQHSFDFLAYFPALISMLLFIYAIWRVIPLIESFWQIKHSSFNKENPLFIYIFILASCLFVNGIIIGLAYIKNDGHGFVETIEKFILVDNDTPHYLGIAEKWYVNDDTDHRFNIVFMPLYPLLIRSINILVDNLAFSGYLIANFFAVLSGVMFYKLTRLLCSTQETWLALLFLYIFPSAFFFFLPLTESLFLFLSISCVYYAIMRRYIFVFIYGFLVTLTRVQGVLLIIPIACEIGGSFRNDWISGKLPLRRTMAETCALLAFPLGLALYLLQNKVTYGYSLQFLVFQREHWSQQMSYFWNTAKYATDYLLGGIKEGDMVVLRGLVIPRLVSFWLTLSLIIYGAKKLRVSLTLYAMAYFVVSFGATWLLSGPRYVSTLFPLAYAAAHIAVKKKAFCLILLLAYSLMYAYYFNEFVLFHFVY